MAQEMPNDKGMEDRVALSIVIPAHNEEDTIKPLFDAIVNTLEPFDWNYEIIFIDDGSHDNTYSNIEKLSVNRGVVKAIRMRKRFGKSMALAAGFREAEGDVVITMDADLQDDPSEIPHLVEKLGVDEWDLVSGWKKDRDDPLEKKLASKIFNAVVSMTSGVKLHDFNCGLKAYRREVIKLIHVYGEQHRFIPVLASNVGFRVTEIPVKHFARKYGKSKYGIRRYVAGVFDLFTITLISLYNRRPLHFIGQFSLLSFIIGFLLAVYVMIMKFGYGETGNRPSLMSAVFFLGLSVQVFIFGLLAELVTHVNLSTQQDTTQFERQRLVRRPEGNAANERSIQACQLQTSVDFMAATNRTESGGMSDIV